MPPFDELRHGMGMNDDAGHEPIAVRRDRRERGAVEIGEAQVGADEDDLVLEELRRQRGRDLRRILAERRHAFRRLAVPGHVDERGARRHAGIGGKRARQARDVLPVGAGMTGIDPAHRVELIGGEIGKAAQLRRDESVHEGALLVGDGALRVGIAHPDRHRQAAQRVGEELVLLRLGRLVEEQVEADGARAAARERGQEIGEEAPIDRRAVGEFA